MSGPVLFLRRLGHRETVDRTLDQISFLLPFHLFFMFYLYERYVQRHISHLSAISISWRDCEPCCRRREKEHYNMLSQQRSVHACSLNNNFFLRSKEVLLDQ